MADFGVAFPLRQELTDNGVPAAGYFLYTYQAGTTTPATTYSDSAGLVPNANPIVLDAAGRYLMYIPTGTSYKFVLKTPANVTVWTVDNVSIPTPAAPPAPAAVPTGAILAYGGTSAPSGYALCDGSAVSRTVTYNALFAVIGTAYGAGDGATTFNLPDLRQRFPLGKATAGTGSVLGSTGGAIDHTHTQPTHTHSFSGTTSVESADTTIQAGSPTSVAAANHTHTFSGTTGASGNDTTGSNNPPFQTVNYIVKL